MEAVEGAHTFSSMSSTPAAALALRSTSVSSDRERSARSAVAGRNPGTGRCGPARRQPASSGTPAARAHLAAELAGDGLGERRDIVVVGSAPVCGRHRGSAPRRGRAPSAHLTELPRIEAASRIWTARGLSNRASVVKSTCSRWASGASRWTPCGPSKNAGVPVISRYRPGNRPESTSSMSCRRALRPLSRTSPRTRWRVSTSSSTSTSPA